MQSSLTLFILYWFQGVGTVFADPSFDFLGSLNGQVTDMIATRLDIPAEDVKVHHVALANLDQCRDASRVRVEIPEREDFHGKTLIFVEGWQQESICGRWTVQADVEIWNQVPVAKNSAKPGEVVEIEWVRARMDQIREPLFAQKPEDISGVWVAMVPISSGAPLKRTHLRRQPDFEKGDGVVVVLQEGALQIRLEGVLLRDALIGDKVKVRTGTTESIVEGILTEDGRVLLK